MAILDSVRRLFSPAGPLGRADPLQKVLAAYDFPFEIVSCVDADAAFERALQMGAVEGYTPVIIPPTKAGVAPESAERRLKRTRRMLAEIGGADAGLASVCLDLLNRGSAYEDDPDLDAGSIRNIQPGNISRPYFAATHPHPQLANYSEVAIVKVPTRKNYELPLLFNYGGWNACPFPIELAAITKHWNEEYGAQLSVISGDSLEYRVGRRPKTHSEAVKLMNEHMRARVEFEWGHAESVEQLAAEFRCSDYWFLWWS